MGGGDSVNIGCYVSYIYIFDAEVMSRGFVEHILVRLLLLAETRSNRPELYPRFFKDDLAPCILKFLPVPNRDGTCCDELKLMGAPVADCMVCTVLLWLFLVPSQLSIVAFGPLATHAWRQIAKYATISAFVAQVRKDDATQVKLGFSMFVASFLLFLGGLVWPEGLKGEFPQHDIDYRSNEWRMLIRDRMAGNGLRIGASFFVLAMILAHLWFLVSVAGYKY
jgi:hypothetical protein